MIKLLIGGSPCTHWSIAQTKNRETEPSGIGWELFKNYLIALEKYKPDYFLYENNKSMSPAIRAQITKELGVEPIEINSALVSAQSRKRLYWTNIPGVEQPEDRGILLRDILESVTICGQGGGVGAKTGLYAVPVPVEPVNITADGKAHTLRASCYKDGIRNMVGNTIDKKTCVAIRVGDMPSTSGEVSGSQSGRIYSLQARPNGGGADGAATGLYAVPAGMAWRGRDDSSAYEVRDDQKANAVTAEGHQSRLIVDEVAIFQNGHGFNVGGIKYDKTPTLTANGDWPHNNFVIEAADGKTHPVYEVRDGKITIKGKQYPIKLADGFYIIRKLTVTECKRLQTVPDNYIFPVSDTQAYKMLGNGWTVDVIAHILGRIPHIQTEAVEVFSMYDGMSCGRIALNRIGARIAAYYATEIDKYAIQTTQHNFPDTVQMGDAFQVRETDWRPPETDEPDPTPDVLMFIGRFSTNGQEVRREVIEAFTRGGCFWFAYILAARFGPQYGAEIMINHTAGHFGTRIGGSVYDITGDVTELARGIWEPWAECDNARLREWITQDCIMF